MNSNLKKEIICSHKAGDWFDRIPLAHLCDSGITAINVDRRFGKTTFVAHAVKKILAQNMADNIIIECGYVSFARYMEQCLKEVLGDDYKERYPQIDIRRKEQNLATCYSNKRRTVTFIDEFPYTVTDSAIS